MKEAQAKVFIITLEFGMPQDGALRQGNIYEQRRR